MKPVVFVPDKIADCGMELLETECECIAPWRGSKVSAEEALTKADAIIVRLFSVKGDALTTATRLKVIGKHGVGVDNIDVAAATARRIPVVFTPTANANAVAEHAVALMLALARHIGPAAAASKAGRFQDRTQFDGVELAGKTLGVIGLGRIGGRVAQIGRFGFDMEVLGYDPFMNAANYDGPAKLESSLDSVLKKADFLSLHMPLTNETRHLLNTERLKLLKPNCRVINTSRGAVIDEQALAQTLSEGRIGGAALDVFDQEPLPTDHVFLRTPNLLLTPHISSSTRESLDRMARDSAQGVLDVLHGKPTPYVVNREVWP
jgi:D-3-phosphoglycerate dehydrogenase